jgi:hypothetical protein
MIMLPANYTLFNCAAGSLQTFIYKTQLLCVTLLLIYVVLVCISLGAGSNLITRYVARARWAIDVTKEILVSSKHEVF